MNERTYKEIGRLTLTAATDVVVSEVLNNGEQVGYSITKYVESPEYTGFSRGVFIPRYMLADFLKLFPQKELTEAISTSRGVKKE